ncbi:hypothetical protein GY45DRAFT_249081 [Cubamyces sp. BRFM 1775]|nr:hypothetical protein GY45DRAFT_249081 [Cubamyces sp. BRFM 1775]
MSEDRDTPDSRQTSVGYNLRPNRTYYGQLEMDDSGRPTHSRSTGEGSSSGSSSTPALVVHRHPAWRPPEFWDSIIHTGDLGRVLREPVVSISDESSEDELEREDDGVPPDQRSPVRVYKVTRPAMEVGEEDENEGEDEDDLLPQISETSRFPTSDEKDDSSDDMVDVQMEEADEPAQNHASTSMHSGGSQIGAKTKRRALSMLLQVQPRRGHRPQPPPALQVSARRLHQEFPDEDFAPGYTCLPDKMLRWGFRCFRCPGAPLLSGCHVGICTTNFVNHLRSAKHRKACLAGGGGSGSRVCSDTGLPGSASVAYQSSADGPPSSTSSVSTNAESSAPTASQSGAHVLAAVAQAQFHNEKPPRDTLREEGIQVSTLPQDEVAGFLRSVGLSPALASALRDVGISDRARMRALGSLPDADYQRVDDCLKTAGLDMVARVLVRSGLKGCAQAGTRGALGV